MTWRGSGPRVSPFAAASGFDDRGRHGDEEDGAPGCASVQSNARTQIRDRDGACAISGGPFKQGYNVLKGMDRYIPVDVHIPGCPPRPEALIHAFMTLQNKIQGQSLTTTMRPRHLDPAAPSEFPVPHFGKHDLEPPNNPSLWKPAPLVRAE